MQRRTERSDRAQPSFWRIRGLEIRVRGFVGFFGGRLGGSGVWGLGRATHGLLLLCAEGRDDGLVRLRASSMRRVEV